MKIESIKKREKMIIKMEGQDKAIDEIVGFKVYYNIVLFS